MIHFPRHCQRKQPQESLPLFVSVPSIEKIMKDPAWAYSCKQILPIKERRWPHPSNLARGCFNAQHYAQRLRIFENCLRQNMSLIFQSEHGCARKRQDNNLDFEGLVPIGVEVLDPLLCVVCSYSLSLSLSLSFSFLQLENTWMANGTLICGPQKSTPFDIQQLFQQAKPTKQCSRSFGNMCVYIYIYVYIDAWESLFWLPLAFFVVSVLSTFFGFNFRILVWYSDTTRKREQKNACDHILIVSILSTLTSVICPPKIPILRTECGQITDILTIKFGSWASKMTLENCWKTL